ncbi:MAG: hypothetical protein FWG64_02605 [Firmicutes bacterium]|nr:hypothetical protein [Bacillota bacterium]
MKKMYVLLAAMLVVSFAFATPTFAAGVYGGVPPTVAYECEDGDDCELLSRLQRVGRCCPNMAVVSGNGWLPVPDSSGSLPGFTQGEIRRCLNCGFRWS